MLPKYEHKDIDIDLKLKNKSSESLNKYVTNIIKKVLVKNNKKETRFKQNFI